MVPIIFSHENLKQIFLIDLLGIQSPTTEFKELFDETEENKFSDSLFKAKKINQEYIEKITDIYHQIQQKKNVVSYSDWDGLRKSLIKKKGSHRKNSTDKELLQKRWNYYYLHALRLFEEHFCIDKQKMLEQQVPVDTIVNIILNAAKEQSRLLLWTVLTKITNFYPDVLLEDAQCTLSEYNKPAEPQHPALPTNFTESENVTRIEQHMQHMQEANLAILSGQRGCGKYTSVLAYLLQHRTEYSYVFIYPMKETLQDSISAIPFHCDDDYSDQEDDTHISETKEETYRRKIGLLERLGSNLPVALLLYDASDIDNKLFTSLKKLASGKKIHIFLTTYKRTDNKQFHKYLLGFTKPEHDFFQKLYHNTFPSNHPLSFRNEIAQITNMSGSNLYLFLAMIQFHQQTNFQYLSQFIDFFTISNPLLLSEHQITLFYHGQEQQTTLSESCRFILNYDEYSEPEQTSLCDFALLNKPEAYLFFHPNPNILFTHLYTDFFLDTKNTNSLNQVQRSIIYYANGNALMEWYNLWNVFSQHMLADEVKPEDYSLIPHYLFNLYKYSTKYNYPIWQLRNVAENLLLPYLINLVSLKMIKEKFGQEPVIKLRVEQLFIRYRTLIATAGGYLWALITISKETATDPSKEESLLQAEAMNLYMELWVYKFFDLKDEYDNTKKNFHMFSIKYYTFLLFTEYYLGYDCFADTLKQFLDTNNFSYPEFTFTLLELVVFLMLPKKDLTKLNQFRNALDSIDIKNDFNFSLAKAVLDIITGNPVLTDDYENNTNKIISSPTISSADLLLLIMLTILQTDHNYIPTLKKRIAQTIPEHHQLRQLWEQVINNRYGYSNDTALQALFNEEHLVRKIMHLENDPAYTRNLNRNFELIAKIQSTAKNNTERELAAQIIASILPSEASDTLFDF